MKGIILAGGHGTRLHPLTLAVSKQLLPVYDKPMIYYPLSVLIECGIEEICVIVKPMEFYNFRALLGHGEKWGVSIVYKFQDEPRGIADAFLVAKGYIKNDSVCLILGDNIFTNPEPIVAACVKFQSGAGIIGYECSSPERYGIMCFDGCGKLSRIEEKPKVPRSAYAVTGIYFYDNTVVAKAKALKPSARGELEITDINNAYIRDGQMQHAIIPFTGADYWLDAGTPDDLHWASSVVRSLQQDRKIKIGCPTEAAKRRDERLHVV